MLQQQLKYLLHTKLFSAIWKKASMTRRPLVNFAKLANTGTAYPQENSRWENFMKRLSLCFVIICFKHHLPVLLPKASQSPFTGSETRGIC